MKKFLKNIVKLKKISTIKDFRFGTFPSIYGSGYTFYRPPPMPTFRVSPIFLVRKRNGDFRLIHNLSYPTQNSVNEFIDPEFCTVRYSSIDDAIDMINRIGKGGKLAKTDIKSAFRLLRVSPSDFDQLGFLSITNSTLINASHLVLR